MNTHALHHLASVSVRTAACGRGAAELPPRYTPSKGHPPPLKGTPTRFYMRVMRTPSAQ